MSSFPSSQPPRRPLRALPAAVTAAVLLALTACSSSDPTAPGAATRPAATQLDTQISQDMAADAGDVTLTLTDLYAGGEALTGAGTFAVAPADGARLDVLSAPPSTTCTGPDASGWFSCARAQEGDFAITRMWRYWSGGQVATRYSEAATDSVNHRWTLTGSHVVTDTATATTRTVRANRSNVSTMRVVRGTTPTHVWSGIGTRTDTATAKDAKGTRSYVVAANDTVAGVTFAVPRKSNQWPLAGTVTHNVRTVWTSVSGATTTTTRRAVVTFNGTQTASVVVGGLTCDIDLKTRRTSNCR